MLKKSEMCVLYKQDLLLVSSAQTLYIFPNGLRPSSFQSQEMENIL